MDLKKACKIWILINSFQLVLILSINFLYPNYFNNTSNALLIHCFITVISLIFQLIIILLNPVSMTSKNKFNHSYEFMFLGTIIFLFILTFIFVIIGSNLEKANNPKVAFAGLRSLVIGVKTYLSLIIATILIYSALIVVKTKSLSQLLYFLSFTLSGISLLLTSTMITNTILRY